MTRFRLAGLAALVGVMTMAAIDAEPVVVSELAEQGDVDGLAQITSVGGVPIDMQRILGDEPEARVAAVSELFSQDGEAGAVPLSSGIDPSEAQAIAVEVLEAGKYDVPAESAFDRFLAQAQAWLVELLGRVVAALGGARNAGLVALAAVTLVGLAGFAFLARRRTATIARTTHLERILAEGGDPDDFERLAALADRDGRWADAIRHRFVAGLLRLDIAGRITFRPGLTTGEIVDELGDEAFTRLARQFEDVAYGGRPATRDMRDRSVEEWRSIFSAEVSR